MTIIHQLDHVSYKILLHNLELNKTNRFDLTRIILILLHGILSISKIMNPIKLFIHTFLSMYWSTIIFSLTNNLTLLSCLYVPEKS